MQQEIKHIMYHISDLEQLSGIKAHTIRIWEKRYNLIEPERTDTNIRLYNDDQVRKLLNVSTLIANGFKISKIAGLTKDELHKKIREIQTVGGDTMEASFINDFVASMLDFNEQAFEKTFSAVVTRYGIFNGMIKVMYPLMQKIGIMWSTGNAMPVQEHFASTILRRKLLSAIDGQLPPEIKNKKFLLVLPPNEWHEIGLLFSDYLLRSKGFQTVYLGANVPYDNIQSMIKQIKVTHILTFLITRREEKEVLNLRKKMLLPSDVKLLIAGNPEIIKIVAKHKNTQILDTPDNLLKLE